MTALPPLDPRFLRGIELLNGGDFLDASDEFEDLYFEVTGTELLAARFFLQLSVGLHHASRRQSRAAIDRLDDGLRALPRMDPGFPIDRQALQDAITHVIVALRRGEPPRPLPIVRLEHSQGENLQCRLAIRRIVTVR
ncbi:MAG: DUF309 domain-containing protein [Thermoanaerobaculia bacterium]